MNKVKGKIKFDSEAMKLIALFESMTGAKVRDCIANGRLIFIIEENDMGKAIGKNGSNVKRIEHALKRKIRLVEFSNDILQFVKNIAYPAEADVSIEDAVVTMHAKDTGTRAMLIGRERQNISSLTNIVKRHFDVKEVKVL